MKDNNELWKDITREKLDEILSKDPGFVVLLTDAEAFDYVEYCLLLESRDKEALKKDTTEEMLSIVTEDVPERLKAICRKHVVYYSQKNYHQINQSI
jgi:hypothetical protein